MSKFDEWLPAIMVAFLVVAAIALMTALSMAVYRDLHPRTVTYTYDTQPVVVTVAR